MTTTPMRTVAAIALVFSLGASRAGAQAAPAAPAAPPRPDTSAKAPTLRPPSPPPPPRGVSLAPGAAARRPPTAAALVAPLGVSAPPESLAAPGRAAAATAVVPPANAVALCGDGSYVMAPGDASACAQHRGLRASFPRFTPPPPAGTTVRVAPAAAMARPTESAPPAGATMRCKDGTYLSGTASAGRCANNGGVATMLGTPANPPPVRPQPQKRP